MAFEAGERPIFCVNVSDMSIEHGLVCLWRFGTFRRQHVYFAFVIQVMAGAYSYPVDLWWSGWGVVDVVRDILFGFHFL
jgi:hypothetical protein